MMSKVEPAKVRGIRTDDFFGRKGGSHAIEVNRARERLNTKAKSKKGATGSSDEYEDVDDEIAAVSRHMMVGGFGKIRRH